MIFNSDYISLLSPTDGHRYSLSICIGYADKHLNIVLMILLD